MNFIILIFITAYMLIQIYSKKNIELVTMSFHLHGEILHKSYTSLVRAIKGSYTLLMVYLVLYSSFLIFYIKELVEYVDINAFCYIGVIMGLFHLVDCTALYLCLYQKGVEEIRKNQIIIDKINISINMVFYALSSVLLVVKAIS